MGHHLSIKICAPGDQNFHLLCTRLICSLGQPATIPRIQSKILMAIRLCVHHPAGRTKIRLRQSKGRTPPPLRHRTIQRMMGRIQILLLPHRHRRIQMIMTGRTTEVHLRQSDYSDRAMLSSYSFCGCLVFLFRFHLFSLL